MIRRRAKALLALSLLLWSASFVAGLSQRQHQVLPEAVGRALVSMAVAISAQRYHLRGYMSYGSVVRVLSAFERGDRQRNLRDPEFLDETLRQAAHLNEPASAGTFPLYQDDKGYINYCKASFALFGYRVEGLYYLYYLLVLGSAACYALTFYPSLDLLWVLCAFLISHLFVAAAAPAAGLDLLAVHNPRFLAVLGILPALHLAWLTLGRRPFSGWVLAGAAAQTSLLMLAIQIRSGTIYQLMFLGALFCLAIFRAWRAQPWLGSLVLQKARAWPLALALAAWLGLKAHMLLALSPAYTPQMRQEPFWHAAFIGLSAHPQSKARYDISADDGAVKERGVALARRRFGVEIVTNAGMDYDIYGRVIKDEFVGILRADPAFVVTSYFYKIPILLKNYFLPPTGIGLWFFLLLAVAVFAGRLAGPALYARPAEVSSALALTLTFSLLPGFITIPSPHLIADPSVLMGLSLAWLAVATPLLWRRTAG